MFDQETPVTATTLCKRSPTIETKTRPTDRTAKINRHRNKGTIKTDIGIGAKRKSPTERPETNIKQTKRQPSNTPPMDRPSNVL